MEQLLGLVEEILGSLDMLFNHSWVPYSSAAQKIIS